MGTPAGSPSDDPRQIPLLVRQWEGNCALGKYTQSLLRDRGLLRRGKDFARALSQLREGHSSYPAHSSLPFSHKEQKEAKKHL